MRMVVFNDPHFSAKPPASRKSTYAQCMLRKLREIVQFCNDSEIDVLACTGDWFISKKPEFMPWWLISDLYQVLSNLPLRCRFISVIGNHDCETTLANFSQSPLFMLLEALKAKYSIETSIVYAGLSTPIVDIMVVNYDAGSTTEGIVTASALFHDVEHVRRIILLHGPVINKTHWVVYPTAFLEKAVQAEDLALANVADFVFYGDIHDYHGIYKIDNTTFVNLGSLARSTSRELDKTRPVLIALYDSETDLVQEIELEDVDPVEEVFRSEEIRRDRQVAGEVEQFVDALDTRALSFSVLTPDILRERITNSAQLTVIERDLGLQVLKAALKED